MKKCPMCKKICIRERNGIRISKFCSNCRKIKKQEKKIKHEQTKSYLERKWKILHGTAWKLQSEYIRRKYAKNDMVQCYTCNTIDHWKNMHCGHFWHNKLDFDERNLRPQCSQCNVFKSGNLAEYATKLTKEIGVEGMQKLRLNSNTISYSTEDLEKIIQNLTIELEKYND